MKNKASVLLALFFCATKVMRLLYTPFHPSSYRLTNTHDSLFPMLSPRAIVSKISTYHKGLWLSAKVTYFAKIT